MRVASHLPLSTNHTLGKLLGSLAWRLDKKSRHVSLTNLRLCFPEQNGDWHNEIGKQSLIAMVQAMFETPFLWQQNLTQLNKLVLNPESLASLVENYEEGNGLIIASPHLGSWELVGAVCASHMKMTTLFRPPRMEELGDLMRSGRESRGATLVPTDSSGVKALTRALKAGEATGILPDQEPGEGNGLFAEFFSQPAYTMPLMLKLAKKRRIPIYFVFAERRESGFFFHINKGKEELYDLAIEESCTVMNGQIEDLIRIRPQQYNWNYKRFRRHPDGINRYHSN